MCGRFNVIDTPGLQQLLSDLGIDLQLPSRANLAPTEPVGLVRRLEKGAQLDAARWWLTPSWAPAVDQKYSMFNARCETLSTSRAFRLPFQRQRGVVLMSSFIEWRKEGGGKAPWLISSADQALAVAALWDVWNGDGSELLSCTLVTTAAAPEFSPWHRRMPVLLTRDEMPRWLDNREPVAANDPLFDGRLKFPLVLRPLPQAVGNARNKNPSDMEGLQGKVELRPGGAPVQKE